MPFTVTMRLTGLGQALANLREVDRRAARHIVPKAIRAAGKVLAKAAKSEAPVDTGVLRRSMTTRVKSYKQGRLQLAIIGPQNKKYNNGRNPANYAHLVELGHRIGNRGKLLRIRGKGLGSRFTGGQGKMLGRHAGNPFMRRAASSADSRAVAMFAMTAATEIAAQVATLSLSF